MAEDIPHLETRMTFLRMVAPGAVPAMPARDDVVLERKNPPDVDEYIALFRDIGHHWLWQARLQNTRDGIKAIINRPSTEVSMLYRRADRKAVGLLELDFADAARANLAYYGLTNDAIGQGFGGFLMKAAIASVFSRAPRPREFWFTTCTFDHPGALGFYRHMGFEAYRQNVPDRFPDPRLNSGLCGGAYPASCAPHVPLAKETQNQPFAPL